MSRGDCGIEALHHLTPEARYGKRLADVVRRVSTRQPHESWGLRADVQALLDAHYELQDDLPHSSKTADYNSKAPVTLIMETPPTPKE